MTSFDRIMDLLLNPIQSYIIKYAPSIDIARVEEEQMAAASSKSPALTKYRLHGTSDEIADSASTSASQTPGAQESGIWPLVSYLATKSPSQRPVGNHRLKRDKVIEAGKFVEVVNTKVNQDGFEPKQELCNARMLQLIKTANTELEILEQDIRKPHKANTPGYFDNLIMTFRDTFVWLQGAKNIQALCIVLRFEEELHDRKVVKAKATGENKQKSSSKFEPSQDTIGLISYLFEQMIKAKVNDIACFNMTILESDRILPAVSVTKLVNEFICKITEIDTFERGDGDKQTDMITTLDALCKICTDIQASLEEERLAPFGYKMPELFKSFVPVVVSAPNQFMQDLINNLSERAKVAAESKEAAARQKRAAALQMLA